MDTTMQQAVKSTNDADNNINGENSTNMNEDEVPTYDQQFPSLGAGGPPVSSDAPPIGRWNQKPHLMSSTITQVFVIPADERKGFNVDGFGGGQAHKLLDSIMNSCSAKIEMSSSKDKSLSFLITGKPDAVLRAKREVLQGFQTQASATINIPKEHHRHLLGKGGAKLQELEKITATKITIPKTNETSDTVSILGTKEGIDKALHEIKIISDEQSKQASERMEVPKIYHPFIQGPNNENINKLTAQYPGVRINIPPLSVMKDELSIAGEKEGVMAVKEFVRKVWKEMEKKSATVSVEVKKSQHRYVIGPKGNAINEILAGTGVSVEMPPNDSDSETITLRGPQDKLGLALTKVYEKANSVVCHTVECPAWLHKYIIGKKGAGIQKISAELTKVHISFTDNGIIKVDGPPDEAERAVAELESQAQNLIKTTTFSELKVDAKYHKHIIGKGGSTINKLKAESDVTINIPDSDSGVTVIRIEGNKAGVEKARTELETLVKKMENEKEKDLIIENRFHKQIIGPKGESVQKIRDEFSAVQVSFPDLGSKSDIVKLRGPKDDVDRCARHLTKLVRDMQESSFQLKLPIFKQFHKFVIGKGGVNIRKIRDETDTKIDLPETGSDSDTITITGRRENVNKASERIQEIQSQMANIVTKDITIPAKIHNTVIGAGGKLIQSIMSECGGVGIKFPEPNSGSDKVTLRGPSEDVEKAVKLLKELSDEKQLSNHSAEVKAKQQHHKFLIGRQGIHIQKIRNETGARIIFPGADDTDKENITIIGTKEAVAKAKSELETRIKELDNIIEETMTVDAKHHKHFVARRGEVLRKIGDEFGGVVVSFPRAGVSSDQVNLKGARNCVDAAKARIQEIVKDLEEMVTIDCEIAQQYHRTVMGAKGSKVQGITREHDVQIKFPDKDPGNGEPPQPRGDRSSDPNIIRITGKKANCEAAAQALKGLVPITAEVIIPFEFHRFIIGQKGNGVREMMNTHDVNIRVPAADQKSDVIQVSGVPSNVESAKGGLAEKLKELEAEKEERLKRSFEVTVEVNPEYHPKIIGKNGGVINKLRKDHDVNIVLPSKGSENVEIITITGLEADALAAKEAILKFVNHYESMIKEEVQIDPRVHPKIIGRRGRSIVKIMSDFNVDIRLPRNGDADPSLVVVSGDEEAVMDCIDHLKMLEEEYIQDVADREWMQQYEKPNRQLDNKDSNKVSKEFKVSKAPWDVSSAEAFPSLSSGGGANAASGPIAWGPKARR